MSKLTDLIDETSYKLGDRYKAIDYFNEFSIKYLRKPYSKGMTHRVNLYERYIKRYLK